MKQHSRTMPLIVVIALLFSLLLGACGGTGEKKMYTIGVVNLAAAFDPILDGFKAGMEEAGFVEGKNVTYIYDGPAASPDALDAIFENLQKEKVDLVLTFGTLTTLRAKESLAGTDIPIVFGPVTDPVASGIVEDRQRPGGNITGIQTGNPAPKRLDWLMKIAPGIKRILVFNNPKDNSSIQALSAFQETAPTFDIEAVIRDTSTPEEIATALGSMPEDIDAIFLLPSAFLEANIDTFVKTANAYKLPLSAPATANVWSGALTSFGHDNVPLGRQAARLAYQILNGTYPGDLPIESAELFLSINLKTANTIGLEISNDVLKVAGIIVR